MFDLSRRVLAVALVGAAALRVRPNNLRGPGVPYNSAQHEPDHGENNEGDVAAGEVFVVFRKSTAAAKPAVGTLNDPPLWQYIKALGRIRALDDLERNAG